MVTLNEVLEKMTAKIQPALCKIGLHNWGASFYSQEKDSFVRERKIMCRACKIVKRETKKQAWDKST